MLEEFYVTRQVDFEKTLRCKKKAYESVRKRQDGKSTATQYTQTDIKMSDKSLDYAKTYEIKKKLLKPMKYHILVSFLIFYIYFINVIIMCDVSANDVNHVNKFKEEQRKYRVNEYNIRQEQRLWKGNRYEDNVDKILKKAFRISRSIETNADDADKSEKYSDEPEFSKYYDYYKNKEDLNNVTEYPQYTNGNILVDDSHAIGYPHDLASNPFSVKKINFNLRPEPHQFSDKIVKLGVLLPSAPDQVFSLVKVLPILEMAVPAVTRADGPLPGWQILVDYRDTECSSAHGPLAAFEFYVNGSADAFIGPGCEYVIAPVARYAGLWGIPVLTAGAQAEAFFYKTQYQTLTRMMGSYTQAGFVVRKVFEEFNWRRIGMLYHNNNPSSGKGNSLCYMSLSAMFSVLKKKNSWSAIPNFFPFDEDNTTIPALKELLQKLSLTTRMLRPNKNSRRSAVNNIVK